MATSISPPSSSTFATRVDQLLHDPLGLVEHSLDRWARLPREEIDALQLAGLKVRFATLRDRVPMLKKLADAERVDDVTGFHDIVPLLFDHTIYKSYPPSLLEKRNFTQINRWLGKLVTPEVAETIAAADVTRCEGLDDWFETMDAAVPQLRVSHTSGTSGTISFLPQGINEWRNAGQIRRMYVWNLQGRDTPQPDVHLVFPYFRKGYLSHLRLNQFLTEAVLPDEAHFHAAYPGTLSSDMLHLAARLRAAQARGTLDRITISPALMARKQELDRMQADMPRQLSEFFQNMADELRGKRIFVVATWTLLHQMAKAGLSRGLEGVFAPDSYIVTTGGAKGLVQPQDWKQDVLRFTGASRMEETYAMSEVVGGSHVKCEHGHYHFSHMVVPYVLDPETSKPLPREGRVTGRAAFYCLGAPTRWGGFITGDEITVEWDEPCPCGRHSRYIVGPIQRYSDKDGGDDKITCAATESSHREAMDFLTALEG